MAIISKGREINTASFDPIRKNSKKAGVQLMMKQLKQVFLRCWRQRKCSTEGNRGELGLVTLWALQLRWHLEAYGCAQQRRLLKPAPGHLSCFLGSWEFCLLASPPDADAAFVISRTGPTLTVEGFLIHCPLYCQVPQCKYCALVFRCQGSSKSVKRNQAHSNTTLFLIFYIYHRPKTMGK